MALQSEPIYGINTGFDLFVMLKFQMKIYQNYKKIWLNHILVVPVEKYQLIL
jgi:hypothetical protein